MVKVLILLLAVVQVVYGIHAFELNRMEPLLLSFADIPFLDFFDTAVRNVKYRDYGPIFPWLLRIGRDGFGLQGTEFRWLPGLLFISSIAWMLYAHFRSRSVVAVAAAALLLISNRYFVYFSTLIAPYSLSFLLTFVSLYFYERGERRGPRFAGLAVGAVSIVAHYTALLPILVAVFLHARRGYFRDRVYALTTVVVLALAAIPKGLMIYELRFNERRAAEGGAAFGAMDYIGGLFQFFGSFSRSADLENIVIAVAILSLFLLGLRRKSGDFQSRWVIVYGALSLVTFIALKGAGLYEIEPRYYLHLLPFIYLGATETLLHMKWGRPALAALIAGSAATYWVHRNDRYQAVESAAAWLAERIESGDRVCSPEQTYYALGLRNTLMYARGLATIDGIRTEEYFECELGSNRPHRIWVYSRDPVSLPFDCSSNPSREDCAASAYNALLDEYRDASENEIRAARHDSVYLKLYILKP